jgi:flagellar protein FliO/FliZ
MDSFSRELLNTLIALAFVGGLAWVALALLKRIQQGRSGAGPGRASDTLRFVRALPVGAKERVVVVQYRGEEWLLGVTTGGISLLSRHPLDLATASPAADRPSME